MDSSISLSPFSLNLRRHAATPNMQLQSPRLKRIALGLAVLLPLTAAFAPRGTAITFAPKEGSSLTKTYNQVLNAELAELSISFNGEEMEMEEQPELSISSVEKIVLTDTYDAVDEGRATKLTRVFDELSRGRTQTFGDESDETEEVSELEGLTVLFTWDGEEETYTAAFQEEDKDADKDLLADLFGDADMLGFLPTDEVEVDDTWSVELIDYRRLFSPSGELVFMNEDGESNKDEIDELLDDNLDGEIECTFTGIEDVDGTQMAVIAFTIELDSEAETSDALEPPYGDMPPGTATRKITTESEYEGTLYFNLAAGHISSATIVGETSFTVEEGVDFELPDGETFSQVQTMVFDGEVEVDITFE